MLQRWVSGSQGLVAPPPLAPRPTPFGHVAASVISGWVTAVAPICLMCLCCQMGSKTMTACFLCLAARVHDATAVQHHRCMPLVLLLHVQRSLTQPHLSCLGLASNGRTASGQLSPMHPYCQLHGTQQTSRNAAAHNVQNAKQFEWFRFGSALTLLQLALTIKRKHSHDDSPATEIVACFILSVDMGTTECLHVVCGCFQHTGRWLGRSPGRVTWKVGEAWSRPHLIGGWWGFACSKMWMVCAPHGLGRGTATMFWASCGCSRAQVPTSPLLTR